MAAVAGEVSKQIKGHSEGAKGFRPWWDVIEDNLLYSFVVLGLITLPMTFFSKTPIECTKHPDSPENGASMKELAKFYPKVYCTETMIEPFLLYLPFTLLLVPMLLTAIEKTFVVMYKVEEKMDHFYNLLLKKSLHTEDLASLETDSVRNCHEIEQAFKMSNDCYNSYVYRTSLEIVGSLLLGIFFACHHDDHGIGSAFFDCEVQENLFLCIIPNSKFFLYIYICTFFLITGYFICSLYNLLWIMSPHVGRLSSFLHGCQREVDFYKPDRKMHKLDENRPTVRLNLYFKKEARDFNLLVNQIAESQGLPEAFRMLSLFEHQFGTLWEPKGISIVQRRPSVQNIYSECTNSFKAPIGSGKEEKKGKKEHNDDKGEKKEKKDKKEDAFSDGEEQGGSGRLQSIVISWNDAAIAKYFYMSYKRRHNLEYTVELCPGNTEAPIKSILYFDDNSWVCQEMSDMMIGEDAGIKKRLMMGKAKKYLLAFDGLLPRKDGYKLIFSTEIDGKTVAQTIRYFECTDA